MRLLKKKNTEAVTPVKNVITPQRQLENIKDFAKRLLSKNYPYDKNNIHSIFSFCGMIKSQGKIEPGEIHDIAKIYDHIYFDGTYYRQSVDKAVLCKAPSFEFGCIFEVGRLISQSNIRFRGGENFGETSVLKKHLIKNIKASKKNINTFLKLLKINPIEIENPLQARTLLYEFIRDGYRASLEDGNFRVEWHVPWYYSQINVVEVPYELLIPDRQLRESDVDSLLFMSDRFCKYLRYLHEFNKQNHFEFAQNLSSVYLFLLDLQIKR